VQPDSTIQIRRHSAFLALGEGDVYLEATRPASGSTEAYEVIWLVDGSQRHRSNVKLEGTVLRVDYPGNPPVDLKRARTIGVNVLQNGSSVFSIKFEVRGIAQ